MNSGVLFIWFCELPFNEPQRSTAQLVLTKPFEMAKKNAWSGDHAYRNMLLNVLML